MKKFLTTLAALAALAVPSAFGQSAGYVTVGEGDAVLTPGTETAQLTMGQNDKGYYLGGTFTVNPGQSFVFYSTMYGMPFAYAPEEDDDYVTLTQVGENVTVFCDMGNTGYWTYAYMEPATISCEVYVNAEEPYAILTRVEEGSGPSVSDAPEVTFNFIGVEDAYQYVTLNGNTFDEPSWTTEISISNYEFNFKYDSGYVITKAALAPGYEEYSNDFSTTPQVALNAYTVTVNPMGDYPDGLVINITVQEEGATSDNIVNLNFTGIQNGYEEVSGVLAIQGEGYNNYTSIKPIENITAFTTIKLGDTEGCILLSRQLGYELNFVGDDITMTDQYVSITPTRMESDTQCEYYNGIFGTNLRVGDYKIDYNTQQTSYSVFENNVTLTFEVTLTPPNVQFVLDGSAIRSTTSYYNCISLTNAETGAYISTGYSNEFNVDLPVKLNLKGETGYNVEYTIQGINITTADNETVTDSELASIYNSSITTETDPENDEEYYVLDLAKEAANLVFTVVLGEISNGPEVTLYFERGEGLANDQETYEGVTVQINGRVEDMDDDYYSFKVAGSYANIKITPSSDEFKLTDIQLSNQNGAIAEDDWNTYASIQKIGDDEFGYSYDIYVYPSDPIEGLQFTVTVAAADAASSGISATLEFAGATNAYSYVNVQESTDGETLTPVTLTGNYNFDIDQETGTMFYVSGKDGASIPTVSIAGETYTQEECLIDPEEGGGVDLPYGSLGWVEETETWFIYFLPEETAANGATITFNVTLPNDELGFYIVGGLEGSDIDEPVADEDTEMANVEGNWMGAFIIQPNNPFKFFSNVGTTVTADSYTLWSPTEVAELTFTDQYITQTFDIVEADNDFYYVLTTDNAWKLNFTIDTENGTIKIMSVEEIASTTPSGYSATLEFADASDAYEYVELRTVEGFDEVPVELTGNTYGFDIDSDGSLFYVSAKEDASIPSVTIGNETYTIEEVLEADFGIEGDYYMLNWFEDQQTWWLRVEYDEAADGATFTFNVETPDAPETPDTPEGPTGTLWLKTPISVTPANNSNVEALYEVVVEWELPLYVNPENTVQPTLNGKTVYGECEGNTLVFNFDALAAGKYTLVIPAMYVAGEDVKEGFVDVYYNRALTLNYVVVESEGPEGPDGPSTGIAFVEADANGLYRVYSLTGANVMNTKEGSELLRLAKGMYIINGQKVIIR